MALVGQAVPGLRPFGRPARTRLPSGRNPRCDPVQESIEPFVTSPRDCQSTHRTHPATTWVPRSGSVPRPSGPHGTDRRSTPVREEDEMQSRPGNASARPSFPLHAGKKVHTMIVDDCTRSGRASRCGSWHCVARFPEFVGSVQI